MNSLEKTGAAPEGVHLAYGRGRFSLPLEPGLAEWRVISPRYPSPLHAPREAFRTACQYPMDSAPLQELIRPEDRVVVVTSDGTRPLPNRELLPWLLEELPVPPEQVTVLVGTGTHRGNTPEEWAEMFGDTVLRKARVVNHDAFAAGQLERAGQTSAGVPVWLNEAYVRADKRIVLGFIEPHFFAGFSGGPKGVAPAVAGLETIFGLHAYDLLADPRSTWGVLEENPVQQVLREAAACCPPDFLINVTLDAAKQLTGIFAGEYLAAHRAGCAMVREYGFVPVDKHFPLVITSNSGFPLDQNVYQSVKGMSAAAQIVQPGGTVLVASACADGVPDHGRFGEMLRASEDAKELDIRLRALPEPVLDQWQVQLFAQILQRCEVGLYSTLRAEVVRGCKLRPVADLAFEVRQCLARIGRGAAVAILPEGPQAVPFVAHEGGAGKIGG